MNILINDFVAVGPEEMQELALTDRIDTKFLAPVSLLPPLLEAMKPLFRIQSANGIRIARYATQYFDTPERTFFLMHQNGKLNRQKIRIRSWLDSQRSFLEIKEKNNRGRTAKKRLPIPHKKISSTEDLGQARAFLECHSPLEAGRLAPVMENDFHRMTFVNARHTERITLDTRIRFVNPQTGKSGALDKLMVLEVKQERLCRSDFGALLLSLRIHPRSFSKYCIGTFLTNPEVKCNRFKTKMHIINKLIR
ncbi:MAG: polyphosphate polymerase domain-containing protein [Tannerellaceae bacterium]|jgi:hypothetical protein|nr:polyphosphate polymerase domain-containing protein [Tannerellaceae bacterium]